MYTPTQAGFLVFIRDQMQIPPAVLPDNSPYIGWAFAVAKEIVLRAIQRASPLIYELCVYNLAADNLVNFAQDQSGKTYFADIRKELDLTSFVAGVVSGTADESTSVTLYMPDAMKNLMISDLQSLKTPWGRVYLGFAQRSGGLWGIS